MQITPSAALRTRQPAARGRVLAAAAAMITLRVRTKDGMERLQVEATATVAAVRELISTQLGVPLEEQVRRPPTPWHACAARLSSRLARGSSSRAPNKLGPSPRRAPLSALLTTPASSRASVWATGR